MADPVSYTSLPEAERIPLPIYRQKWAQIRTHFRRHNRLHDWSKSPTSCSSSTSYAVTLLAADLPPYLKHNMGLQSLVRNKDEQLYEDNLFLPVPGSRRWAYLP